MKRQRGVGEGGLKNPYKKYTSFVYNNILCNLHKIFFRKLYKETGIFLFHI